MLVSLMIKKLQNKTIHTKSGKVILKEAEYWTQEAAAISFLRTIILDTFIIITYH